MLGVGKVRKGQTEGTFTLHPTPTPARGDTLMQPMTHLSVVKTAGRQRFYWALGLQGTEEGSRPQKGTLSPETSWKKIQE